MSVRLRRLLALVGALAVVLATFVVPATPALAASPAAPTGLSPDGGSVSTAPVLSWDRVSGATKYRVEVSANTDFSSPFFTVETVNLNAVPTSQVPAGNVYWRVRGIGSENGEWASATFVRDPVSPPANRTPVDGDDLQAPDEVPTLVWSSVPSAESYDVQVSDAPSFSSDRILASATGRKNTSYTLPKLQPVGTYYWRVSAQLGGGRTTSWSDPTSYDVSGLAAPGLVSPADDPSGATPITEVVLDWTPVAGAVTYELQIDTDENFTTPDHAKAGIVSTRYSPPAGLKNDQYYWRVRAYDADGNKPEWTQVAVWQFRRSWPDQPTLEYPLDNDDVGDPFFYQWSAVPWASSYQLQVDDNPQLSSPATCTTVHTTFTPIYPTRENPATCMPQPGKRTYWRVIAVDAGLDIPTVEIAADVHSFFYDVERAVMTAPRDGAVVETPILRWEPVRGAKSYRVTVTANSTASGTTTLVTHATSFTPRKLLAAGEYRWEVHPIFDDGREGTILLPSSQPRFTVTAPTTPTALSPEPTGPQGEASLRFPTLTWTRVADSANDTTEYRILVRRSDESTYRRLADSFQYPAGEDGGTGFLLPGTYEWKVEAYRDGQPVVTSSGAGSFVISAPGLVAGYLGSLTGTALYGIGGDELDTCDLRVPEGCTNLRQTPVLAWDSVPGASYYELLVSRDSELTNVLRTVKVNDTRWTPTDALPDSQAGSAYFIFVRPCTPGACAPRQNAERAFSKLSMGVDLVAPAAGAVVQDDIALSWSSLLDVEQTPAAATDTDVAQTPARTEARDYTVQLSTREDFATTLLTQTVEQTTYTAITTSYPDGPIYWRVRANDGSSNTLPWSAVRSFTRKAPTPAPLSPVGGQIVRGEQRFSWEPRGFAKAYDLEVYDRVPQAGSTTGRFINVTTTQASYAAADRLAVSATPYYWRVRRVDAGGYRSEWSELSSFYSAGDAPALRSPAAGVTVSPTVLVFSWEAPQTVTARSFKWEYRPAGTTAAKASVETRALDYAIVSAFAAGDYDWRVVALDTAGTPLGASAWRAFSVVDPPVATTAVRIEGSGRINTLLQAIEPTWNVTGVETTYQWFRGRNAIANATDRTYRVVEADRKQSLTVKATGTKPGYKAGSSTSNAVIGGDVTALQPTSPASISGPARVGGRLVADPGTWPGSPDFDYQWYRSGKAIPGATSAAYPVVADDAGRDLAVLVTADDPDDDFGPGQSVAGPERIAKLSSTTRMSATRARIKASQRGSVNVLVRAGALAHPGGRVTILDGRRALVTRTLGSKAGGRITIVLPRLARGRHVLRASYAGSAATLASTSSPVALTVVK